MIKTKLMLLQETFFTFWESLLTVNKHVTNIYFSCPSNEMSALATIKWQTTYYLPRLCEMKQNDSITQGKQSAGLIACLRISVLERSLLFYSTCLVYIVSYLSSQFLKIRTEMQKTPRDWFITTAVHPNIYREWGNQSVPEKCIGSRPDVAYLLELITHIFISIKMVQKWFVWVPTAW